MMNYGLSTWQIPLVSRRTPSQIILGHKSVLTLTTGVYVKDLSVNISILACSVGCHTQWPSHHNVALGTHDENNSTFQQNFGSDTHDDAIHPSHQHQLTQQYL